MNRHVIRLTSVTYAIRAQKLLEQRGIRSYIRKLTQSLGVYGCGYGLEIAGDLDSAVRIIEAAGIRIVEIAEDQSNDLF